MDESLRSRRAVLGGATAAAVGAGALYWGLSGGGNPGTAEPESVELGPVPKGVDAVAYADGDALLSDDGLRRVASAGLAARVGSFEGPTDVSELAAAVEDTYGLDPSAVSRAVAFTTIATEDPIDSMAGVVAEASWSAEAIPGNLAAAGFETTEREIEGVTVYDVEGRITSLGVLGDGRFVVGSGGGTDAVVAIEAGEADPLDDDLVDAFRETRRGPLRVAARFPPLVGGITTLLGTDGELIRDQLLDDLDSIGGTVYAADEQRAAAVLVRADSESAAERFQSVVEGSISIAIASEPDDGPIPPALDAITVEQDGTLVTMRYGDGVDALETLASAIVPWAVGRGPIGLTGGDTGTPNR